FIIGLENETAESIEDTYRWAMDWDCDMANWIMYTPWPFSDLFEELGDKVEVRDYARYNFVTPIMKPEAMTRSEVFNGVMKNYRRFYMRKSFFSYPWLKDRYKRKYMLGCLKAAMKSGFERRFYDLGRINYRGQKDIDFKFDESRVLTSEELAMIESNRPRVGSSYQTKGAAALACGGGPATHGRNGQDAKGSAPLTADVLTYSPKEDEIVDPAAVLGEAPIDEFFDPRGFAKQRSRAKRLSAVK
ncbi:MAG: hypothetical protein P8172_14480, partial [Gammaproteobacteria bacterium]